MKRVLKNAVSIALAAVMSAGCLGVSAFGADDEGLRGDTDGNGVLTANDAAVLLSYVLNPEQTNSEWRLSPYVTNVADGDGSLAPTAADAALILKKVLDVSTEFAAYIPPKEPGDTDEYDLIVDGSVSESLPEENLYKTVQEAYSAAEAGTEDNPTIILIKPGVYLMNGDETKNGLSIEKDYLTFIGDSENAADIVLADNRGNNQGASNNYNSASVVSNCTGLVMKNISIYNYCNTDVPFEYDPSQALSKRSDLETQAFAYIGLGDKHIYENCSFVSILDTMSCDARSYFKDCYVQGTNDFMGGSGVQYWESSTINSLSNHIVGGGNKIVFDDCTFLLNKPSKETPTYFCKGWTTITLLNCVIPSEQGTYQWTPTLPFQYMFGYYNCTDNNGEAASITDNSCALALTEEQAAAYNIWNVLRGDDNWDPAGRAAEYADKGSEPMYVEADSELTVKTGDEPVTISASVYPSRANGSVVFSAEGDITIEQNGSSCTVTATNSTLETTYATIYITAENGIKNKMQVTVEPKIEDAPTFTKEPSLYEENGAVYMDYAVDLGVASHDSSLITWYRCDDTEGTNPVTVADTKVDDPTKSYTLCEGDIGKYIRATIAPKSELSNAGDEVTAVYSEQITADMITTRNISTDFQSVPTHPPFITSEVLGSTVEAEDGSTYPFRNTLLEGIGGTVAGKWNFIGDWYYNYGSGTYAEKVIGIITGVRYCRAIYKQPTDDYGDMKAVVSLTPEKTAGQGFGSAGQYQEILIKYDPDTQTGYGIRYTRSSTATNTVDFQLYEYNRGSETAISELKSMTASFRSNCVITIANTGTDLKAKVETDYDETAGIELEAQISGAQNTYGGFEIYHQGTTGGRFVVTNVDLIY